MHELRTDLTLADAYARGWAMTLTCRACGHARMFSVEEMAGLPDITFADYASRVVCTECGARDPIMGMRQAMNTDLPGSWVPNR